MATELIMPKVDMVMETGTFVEWLKQEGETVKKGEALFVILTDKANIEIEAPADGILAGIRVQPDDVVPVTEIIGYILDPGEDLPAPEDTTLQLEAKPEPSPSQAPAAASSAATPTAPTPERGGKVRATPAARRLSVDLGIDLSQLQGRGPAGRIHKADVLAAAEQGRGVGTRDAVRAAQVGGAQPLPDAAIKETIPLQGARRVIADRMLYSASAAPHIHLSLRVDMSEAARLRERVLEPIQSRRGVRLSYTTILGRAVASVLPRHPFLNASLDGERIIVWDDVHLGIAMSMEDYLVVPVIRDANTKDLEEMAVELADLTERARERRLLPAEMSGSTFTISNLGMFGIEAFTAIINPPETAILAVGAIVETPVSVDGEIKLRPAMNLTLGLDHRVVDGAAGAAFLADLRNTLENPYLLI